MKTPYRLRHTAAVLHAVEWPGPVNDEQAFPDGINIRRLTFLVIYHNRWSYAVPAAAGRMPHAGLLLAGRFRMRSGYT